MPTKVDIAGPPECIMLVGVFLAYKLAMPGTYIGKRESTSSQNSMKIDKQRES